MLTLGAGLVGLIDPLLLKWMVDSVLPARQIRSVLFAAVLFVIARFVSMSCGALSGILIFRATQGALFKLRAALVRQITGLSLDFHIGTSTGQTLFLVEKDVELIIETGSSALIQILALVSSVLITIGMMLYLSPVLLTIVVPANLLFIGLRRTFGARLVTQSERVQQAASSAMASVQEHLWNVPQIQLLRAERRQMHRTAVGLTDSIRAEWRRRATEMVFSNTSLGIVVLGTASVLAVGGVQVIRDQMTVGGLLASYALLARLFDPLGIVTGILAQLGRVQASVRRVRAAFERRPAVPDGGSAVFHGPISPVFAFEGVSFGYQHPAPLLRDITFRFEPGEKIGLTGRSGSGKTTLARLIARLYDPTAGRITADCVDIRDYTLHSLRGAVCFVHQEACLFDRTVAENLRFGAPGATDSDLWAALRTVRMDERLRALGTGLETAVGQQGVRFSGGERQRLVLARAVLARPAVLVLDEATAALDEATEREVLDALREEYPQQTLILITHRSSALAWADRVIVLEQGRIVADGSPDSPSIENDWAGVNGGRRC